MGRATAKRIAIVLPLVGIASAPAPARELEFLKGHRCMMAAPSRKAPPAAPLLVLAEPRAHAAQLGTLEEPIIAPYPPRRVRGYVGVLLRDGRSGWLRIENLVPWRQASYPRLSCIPIRLPDGMLDVTYAHPG